MKELVGKLTAALAEKEGLPPGQLVDKINLNINPPEKVTAENVYIRAMYIVSDKVNSFGGKFPIDEHVRLLPLLIDTPVLVGHRKDSLPIARTFHAEMVEKDNTHWIKAYFYWLKNAEGAETLKNNIDGGIYRECSISFIFAFPECSICGSDMRRCGHRPFQKYMNEKVEREAFFNYRQIEKVLESSLVYRGAVPDTSLTNELLLFTGNDLKGIPAPPLSPRNRIWELNRFRPGQRFLVSPAYESLRVVLEKEGADIRLYDVQAREILSPRVSEFLKGLKLPADNFMAEGRLLGLRGKERRPAGEIVSLLRGEKSQIRRLELRLVRLISHEGFDLNSETPLSRRQLLEKLLYDSKDFLLPAEIASPDNRGHILTRLATRLGLEMTALDDGQEYHYSPGRRLSLRVRSSESRKNGFTYSLETAADPPESATATSVFSVRQYQAGDVVELAFPPNEFLGPRVDISSGRITDLCGDFEFPDRFDSLSESVPRTKNKGHGAAISDSGALLISMADDNSPRSFRIANLNADALASGKRLLAEETECHGRRDGPSTVNNNIRQERRGNAFYLDLGGTLSGRYILRPAVINHCHKFLFYKAGAALPGETSNESQ